MPGALDKIQAAFRSHAPNLSQVFFEELAPRLIPADLHESGEKTFNDPVWRNITLPKHAVALLELPLMQRLRYVRQLGVAHILYPGAHHSRLEHSIGTAFAAKLMFEALHDEAATKLDSDGDTSKIIICAALLHDCGHAAFSHVGEAFLEDTFSQEFKACRTLLTEYFPATYDAQTTLESDRISSGAAEIASLLFILSPAFLRFAQQHSLSGHRRPEECVLLIAALILGRPRQDLLLDSNRQLHSYISSIVSGDLDADKIDYVSRDAYYAGILVSVDITRLLGQLRTVKVDRSTRCEVDSLLFGAPNPDGYYLFGISPAGISALEMFVFTRSYLFDRIYTHHKVKAAELAVEKTLAFWREIMMQIEQADENKNKIRRECVRLLYDKGGDDALLARVMGLPALPVTCSLSPEDEVSLRHSLNSIAQRAEDIFDRRLPYRALALSFRSLAEDHRAAQFLWNNALDSLSDRWQCRELAKEIGQQVGVEASDIYVFSSRRNPVKENPDIWVDMRPEQTLRKVSSHFNTEQLANAYRDIKMIQWIFTTKDARIAVAAGAALVLKEKFDVLIGHPAVEKAKLSMAEIINYLRGMEKPSASRLAQELAENSQDRPLLPPKDFFIPACQCLPQRSRDALCQRLDRELREIKVPHWYYDALVRATIVLEKLLAHANINWGGQVYGDEAKFQADVKEFLMRDKAYN